MNCIIVDDEPLAREGIKFLVDQLEILNLTGSFNNASSAREFIENNQVDLAFLDIQMPGISGIELAKNLMQKTLIIFTTAYSEFALDSYELEAIDYLLKPIKPERFNKAVEKADSYFKLLAPSASVAKIEQSFSEYFFVKADRMFFKVYFKEILIIEGLKDYVIVHTQTQKIITAMNIKTIHDQLPKNIFARISKSYIINVQHIVSFDNNKVFVQKHEVPIGSAYRSFFFDEFVAKNLISR